MNRNQVIKILIVLLVVFNLVQWWPNNPEQNKIESWQEIHISQLKVYGVNNNYSLKHNMRNLFYAEEENIPSPVKIKKPKIAEKKYLNADLSDLKLVGVLFKNKRYEAYLTKGDDYFKVTVNKFVTLRYKVKRINIKSIKLKDIQTGRLHEILLSDGLIDTKPKK